jgi:hypothetical protein
MTERNIITIIIVIAIIICIGILVRNPPSFLTYSPAAAGSFSTYAPTTYSPNYQGASSFNAYYPTAYPTTTYPSSFQIGYPSYPAYYQTATVSSYNDCVSAGYPVMQTYPQQCRTPSGQVFTQNITTTTTTYTQPQTQVIYTTPTTNTGACYVGGCSQELCSDQPNAVSSCVYSPQTACFKQNSMCTRQANGQCGWTQTQGLLSCLGGDNS